MNRPTTTASNLFRRQLCPGSAFMEAGLPEEESEFAREGTLLHDYSSHPEYDRAMLKPNQRDLLALTDSLTKTVIERIENEHGLKGKPTDEFTERTLTWNGLSGTPDFVRYYDSLVGLVIDRKFGYNVVDRADINLQLRVYAVLANATFVAIVQPRAPYDERITIAEYTPQDLTAAAAQIQSILEASQTLDAPLVAGEEQCRYCKAKLVCPAFRDAMLVPAVLAPDTSLSKAAKEAYLAQRVAECSDEQLEKIMLADQLSRFAHDIILDEARKRIAAGALTNYSLSKPTEVRSVSDVRRALALLNLAGLPKDELYDCISNMSLTKVGDLVRETHPDWGWKEVNTWVNTKLKTVLDTETRKERVIRK